ncbi:MAG: RNA polymerase sigma factor [Verrucomicrobiota bacterium]
MSDLNTSQTLIYQLQHHGTEQDWSRFCKEYTPYIQAMTRKHGLAPADCEEITQDVLVKVWKALPKFLYNQERCKFRTWLCTICRNTVINFINSAHNKRSNLNVPDGADVLEYMHADNALSDEEEKQWRLFLTRRAWDAIQPRFKETPLQVYALMLKGAHAKEAARECGIQEDTAYKYRKKIQDAMSTEIRRLSYELDG